MIITILVTLLIGCGAYVGAQNQASEEATVVEQEVAQSVVPVVNSEEELPKKKPEPAVIADESVVQESAPASESCEEEFDLESFLKTLQADVDAEKDDNSAK